VRPTLEDLAGQAPGAERGLDEAHVAILAGVAGGHDRQGLDRIGKPVAVECTRSDERGELERLRR
jgi:hypothetical protein